MSEDPDWWVANATRNGSKYLIRAVKFEPNQVALEGFTKLIVITYTFDSDVSGMPATEQVIAELENFEDLLIQGIEAKGTAIKTSSITGGGKRRLEYYTRDSGSFMAALNQTLPRSRKLPIELEELEDPNWSSIRKLNDVRRTKGKL